MKKWKLRFLLILAVFIGLSLWFYGYHSRKSNDNIPSKALMVSYYAEQGEELATRKLLGYQNTQLHEVWGEPDGTLFGFWGDIWETDDSQIILVYYDRDGLVELVKVTAKPA